MGFIPPSPFSASPCATLPILTGCTHCCTPCPFQLLLPLLLTPPPPDNMPWSKSYLNKERRGCPTATPARAWEGSSVQDINEGFFFFDSFRIKQSRIYEEWWGPAPFQVRSWSTAAALSHRALSAPQEGVPGPLTDAYRTTCLSGAVVFDNLPHSCTHTHTLWRMSIWAFLRNAFGTLRPYILCTCQIELLNPVHWAKRWGWIRNTFWLW